MDIQSAALNEFFVLYPVIIQGWVSPVKPADIAHGGIPKALYDGQAQGLECLVDPWTELQLRSWIMAADDRVDLYVNGDPTPVTGKTIASGEEQLRVRLYLPHGYLMQGVNRLHYKVTRPGGNVEPSRDLNVLYHLRPADNLDLVIPADVLKDGVSAARAAQGVEFGFTYANRRNHDRIEFLLGDTQVRFDVPDGTAPITHTLFTDTFQKAGDNPSAVAEFYVVDQLGNRVKSPEKRLDIHLDRLDLSAPTVKGQTGTNFSPTQPEVRVLVPQGSLLPSDKLSVIWKGATDVPAGSYPSPQRLVSAGLEIAVPRSVLAYSLTKTVTVTYVIERNGKLSPSLPLNLNILALPATALTPPKIVEADANNFLDVMAQGSKNATIHALLHTLIEAGQPCWLSLEGKKADGTAHNLALWNGLPAQVNTTWINQGFWPAALANSYLKQLGHGTTLTIKFKVSLDKSNNPATATVFPDRTYTIKAVELVVPTLDNVLDAGNKEVLQGGLTVSTTLKLKGTAAKGQPVEIFDGSGASAVSKGTVSANPTTGIWEHTITVPVGGRRLYAQSRYHPTSVYSNVRTLTVTAVVAPTISSVKGSPSGVEIPNGGTTVETSVTLTGTASKGQSVEIFDGSGASAVSKGTATAHPTTGDWERTITVPVGGRRLYAKSLYHSTATYSNVHLLTVVAVVSPTITSVKGGSASGPEIPNGTSTTATTFVFTGKASANQKIELRDKGAEKATIPVGPTGNYSHTLTDQAQGDHSYTVKATYGALPESAARTLKVVAGLSAGNDRTLVLSGFIVAQDRAPRNFPAAAIFTQQASGGLSPYKSYTSNNPSVASVTNQGTVTCKANGTATITVTDSANATASYIVQVSGIKTMLRNDATWRTWPEAYNYCQARGGRLATLSQMQAFYNLYAREGGNVAALLGWPLIQNHPSALFGAWVADGGGGSHYFFNLTGTLAHGYNAPYGPHGDGYRRPALCLIG
ncbi:Ig-like domain-containing protein [Pseudomonas sp. B21-015]|uniref:Ig-like domain-containing protein n=1 Tax=Pseudomonas sp. B21-015 TaxID=2895473 RepID=UPI00215E11ED|nr:Ig-like domain-containing protein [Pseudomonas sp. B21-015]UVM48999.1 Ig-like domain-containing protein [Pseudomonas sp. B21-015]